MEDKKMVENETDEMSDIVELVDEEGIVRKFNHIGTMEYKDAWYVFFTPAEEIEDMDEEEVIVFSLGEDKDGKEVLSTLDDEALMEEVYEEFCRQMDEEEDAEEAEECECDHECSCGHCDCDKD